MRCSWGCSVPCSSRVTERARKPPSFVIAVDEEYSVLETAALTPVKQALVNHGGSAFDRFEVKLPESDRTVTLFFNVDRPHAQLARTLQKKQ